jgi:FkbM family methyltransferase
MPFKPSLVVILKIANTVSIYLGSRVFVMLIRDDNSKCSCFASQLKGIDCVVSSSCLSVASKLLAKRTAGIVFALLPFRNYYSNHLSLTVLKSSIAAITKAQKLLIGKRTRPSEALAILMPQIKKDAGNWKLYHYIGLAHLLLLAYDKSKNMLLKALDKGGNSAETNYLLAKVCNALKEFDQALSYGQQAVTLKPDYAEAFIEIGLAHQGKTDLEQALKSFQMANQLAPKNDMVAYYIAEIYSKVGNHQEAEKLFGIAIQMNETNVVAKLGLGKALARQQKFDQAEKVLLEVGGTDNAHIGSRIDLAEFYKEAGRYQESFDVYEKALAAHPNESGLIINYANLLTETGQSHEAEIHLKKVLETGTRHTEAITNYLMIMHYNPQNSAEYIFEEHKRLVSVYNPAEPVTRKEASDKNPERKLRVGFISGGLRAHPVGWMITAALEYLPKDKTEVYCYYNHNIVDEVTKRIHAASGKWVNVQGFTDEIVADMIRQDDIDILVELSGHSGENRLKTICYEPAPVIVKWVGGLFNTSALEVMDYLITDWHETPEGSEGFYTEKLVRMPDDYVCYMPPPYAPGVAALPAQENGYITFGCFNNPSKINTELISRWSVLLKRVDGSVLLLKSKSYSNRQFKDRILGYFAEFGISADRIRFEEGSHHAELLGTYSKVDIALDPWPYSGGLTTCEALWMGVPVVTLPGPTFAGRHSVTHLVNAGLPGMVAGNWDEYVDIAAGLASDLDALAALRAGLRDQVAASPLCDGERFGAAFGQALRAMWHAYVEGRLKQDHIAVDLGNTNDLRTGKSIEIGQKEAFATGHDVGGLKTDAVAEDEVVSLDSKKGENTLASLERQATAKLNGDVDVANRAETQNGSASEVEYLSEASSERTDDSENLSAANGIADSDDTNRPELEGTTEEHTEAKSVSLPVNVSDSTDNSGSGSTDEEIEKVARVPWERGNHENLLVHGKYGVKYSVPGSLEVMTTYVLLEQGQWFDGEIGFVNEYLQSGMQVVDVGAGFGAYALGAALKVGPTGKVYAFEPVDNMRKNLDISKVENGLSNLEVSGRALGAVSGKMGMSKNATPELTVLESDGGEVQEVTLDNWWDFEGNPQLDVIKIDVNGHEADVLKGADRLLSTTSPIVVIAASGFGPAQESMVNYLTSMGYTFFDYIAGVGVLSPVEDWSQRDAYAQNVVAVKAERVAELKELGWIHNENIEVGEPEIGYWKKTLKAMPWTDSLYAEWEKNSLLPEHNNYYRAIDYICTSRFSTISKSEKVHHLVSACNILLELYNGGSKKPELLMNLASVFSDVGKRYYTVLFLKELMDNKNLGRSDFGRELPFFPSLRQQENLSIYTTFEKWFLVRAVEGLLSMKYISGWYFSNYEKQLRSQIIETTEDSVFSKSVDLSVLHDEKPLIVHVYFNNMHTHSYLKLLSYAVTRGEHHHVAFIEKTPSIPGYSINLDDYSFAKFFNKGTELETIVQEIRSCNPQVIIFGGLFFDWQSKMINKLCDFPLFWAIWGGDLYNPIKSGLSLQPIVDKLTGIITPADGDFELFKQHYGNKYRVKSQGALLLGDITSIPFRNSKKNRIIIGNSGDVSNHHMMIIEMLTKKKDIKDYQLYIPFAYNGSAEYLDRIISYLKKKNLYDNTVFQFNKIDSNLYAQLISESKFCLFAHQRQQALQTTYTALYFGCLPYIRKEIEVGGVKQINPSWQLLHSIGIDLPSIESFDEVTHLSDIQLPSRKDVEQVRKLLQSKVNPEVAIEGLLNTHRQLIQNSEILQKN